MSEEECVSVTVDIWSDRKMRGFLGVTGHVMDVDDNYLNLIFYLLGCSRFKGSHTGDKISTAFKTICDKYEIQNKIEYNASSMKKAFTVCLTRFDQADEGTSMTRGSDNPADDVQGEDEVDHDDESIWETSDAADQATVDQTLAMHCEQQHLGCYAHTLQLTVSDGFIEGRSARPALAKASRLSTLMHTSGIFHDRFESKFGSVISISAAVCTRWNSTLKQVQSIIRLTYKDLSYVCTDHLEALPTEREWKF